MTARYTEESLERRCSLLIDHLDRLLLSGHMTQATYDAAMRDLDAWAELQYRRGNVRRC